MINSDLITRLMKLDQEKMVLTGEFLPNGEIGWDNIGIHETDDYIHIMSAQELELRRDKDLHLWKFYWDCGRMGNLDGLILATDKEVECALGRQLDFGEALGKHSQIYGELEPGDLEKVEAVTGAALSRALITDLHKVFGKTVSGYNPFDHMREEEVED